VSSVTCLLVHMYHLPCSARTSAPSPPLPATLPLIQLSQRGPCAHNVAHANAAVIPLAQLYHPRHTMARWRAQFLTPFPVMTVDGLTRSASELHALPYIPTKEGQKRKRGPQKTTQGR
jgi:hypothetical protein